VAVLVLEEEEGGYHQDEALLADQRAVAVAEVVVTVAWLL
jgi:hypothetical protein